MHVFSHRGYHQQAPENTYDSFARAVAMGVDGIETDVRISADHVVVLFHDRVLKGTPISCLTHAELNRRAGYEVPTMVEALRTWDQITWNLEIKRPIGVDLVLAALEPFREAQSILVTSDQHHILKRFGQQLGVDCGVVMHVRPFSLDQICRESAWLKVIAWEFEAVDSEMLAIAAQQGLLNYVFNPHTPEEHAECQRVGLDGIITDRPEFVRCALPEQCDGNGTLGDETLPLDAA